jgi:hypothetical protein
VWLETDRSGASELRGVRVFDGSVLGSSSLVIAGNDGGQHVYPQIVAGPLGALVIYLDGPLGTPTYALLESTGTVAWGGAVAVDGGSAYAGGVVYDGQHFVVFALDGTATGFDPDGGRVGLPIVLPPRAAVQTAAIAGGLTLVVWSDPTGTILAARLDSAGRLLDDAGFALDDAGTTRTFFELVGADDHFDVMTTDGTNLWLTAVGLDGKVRPAVLIQRGLQYATYSLGAWDGQGVFVALSGLLSGSQSDVYGQTWFEDGGSTTPWPIAQASDDEVYPTVSRVDAGLFWVTYARYIPSGTSGSLRAEARLVCSTCPAATIPDAGADGGFLLADGGTDSGVAEAGSDAGPSPADGGSARSPLELHVGCGCGASSTPLSSVLGAAVLLAAMRRSCFLSVKSMNVRQARRSN